MEVQVRLRCLLGDGYRILKWVEFWERLFFRGLGWSRPLMVFLAKVEVRTRLMQRHLESPLIYIGEALAGMGELPRVRVASVEEREKGLVEEYIRELRRG